LLSFRYHALSLVAVFCALAIGVVLGVAIGDKGVVSGARRDLEKSLRGDLNESRKRSTEVNSQLDVRNSYERDAYPSLVRGLIRKDRVGVVAMGKLPDGTVDDVRAAIEPAGARLVSVAVVAAPLQLARVSSDLGGRRLARRLNRSQRRLSRFGRAVGRQIVEGGDLVSGARHSLFSSSRGQLGRLDAVVFVRDRGGLKGRDEQRQDTFESAFLDGMDSTGATIVGVEAQGTDPSQIGFMKDHDISSVDDIDLAAGQTALVYVLAGEDGHFGTRENALLPPRPSRRAGGG
jgi:Copper transport outer membrane protein, MctB